MSSSRTAFQTSVLLPPPSGFCRNCLLRVSPWFHLLYHDGPLHTRIEKEFVSELIKERGGIWKRNNLSFKIKPCRQGALRNYKGSRAPEGPLGFCWLGSFGLIGDFFCTRQGTGVQLFHSQEHHSSQRCLSSIKGFPGTHLHSLAVIATMVQVSTSLGCWHKYKLGCCPVKHIKFVWMRWREQ